MSEHACPIVAAGIPGPACGPTSGDDRWHGAFCACEVGRLGLDDRVPGHPGFTAAHLQRLHDAVGLGPEWAAEAARRQSTRSTDSKD